MDDHFCNVGDRGASQSCHLGKSKKRTLENMKTLATTSRLVAFSAFWLALTGAAVDALYHGLPVVLLATWISLVLYPAGRPGIRLWWAVPYVPHLLLRGFWGGLDVARRVLDPRLPVRPDWRRVPLLTNIAEVNAVLGGVVSVLPGSLAAGTRSGALEVHVVDTEDFDRRSLEAEERRVLRLFGVPVPAHESTEGRHGSS